MNFVEKLKIKAEEHPENNGFYFGAIWARNEIIEILASQWDQGDRRFRNVLDLVDWLQAETKENET